MNCDAAFPVESTFPAGFPGDLSAMLRIGCTDVLDILDFGLLAEDGCCGAPRPGMRLATAVPGGRRAAFHCSGERLDETAPSSFDIVDQLIG